MTDSSRTQGAAICVAAVVLGGVFGIGLLSGAWWAVALPVGILLAFVLGLTFWVGWTIATIQVDPELEPPTEPASPPKAEARTDAESSA
jgi:protein-S-isoprenylcysteine O-methyltransferase Ste14